MLNILFIGVGGFIGAVSTDWGVANSSTDYYQLPRFTPWVAG